MRKNIQNYHRCWTNKLVVTQFPKNPTCIFLQNQINFSRLRLRIRLRLRLSYKTHIKYYDIKWSKITFDEILSHSWFLSVFLFFSFFVSFFVVSAKQREFFSTKWPQKCWVCTRNFIVFDKKNSIFSLSHIYVIHLMGSDGIWDDLSVIMCCWFQFRFVSFSFRFYFFFQSLRKYIRFPMKIITLTTTINLEKVPFNRWFSLKKTLLSFPFFLLSKCLFNFLDVIIIYKMNEPRNV